MIQNVGIATATLSLFGILYVLAMKIFAPSVTVSGWSFIVISILFVGGVQLVMLGILAGLVLIFIFSFGFFFGAERRIRRALTPMVAASQHINVMVDPTAEPPQDAFGMRVSYFLSSRFHLRKVRDVSHYSQNFLDLVFKRHHFSGILSIMLAFARIAGETAPLIFTALGNQYWNVNLNQPTAALPLRG